MARLRSGFGGLLLLLSLLGGSGSAFGQTESAYSQLYSFQDAPRNPFGSLVLGTDGFVYGLASAGGTAGDGVVFKVSPSGAGYVVLHNFSAADGVPASPLLQGTDGMLYGTTEGGTFSAGAVFKMATDGSNFQTIYGFSLSDGGDLWGGLIQGADGLLYGVASAGGANGYGSVFRLATDGSAFQKLHDFASTDGYSPQSPLLQTVDGSLYGTTLAGGANGDGVLFTMSTDGSTFTKLLDFAGADGASPGALIQGANGLLYGTTFSGGASGGGILFSVATDGTGLADLYDFQGTGGFGPDGILQAPSGTLYGTTGFGGANGKGAVFSIAPDGSSFAKLHDFDQSDGNEPSAPLVRDATGVLYGLTVYGAAYNRGEVFSIHSDGTAFSTVHTFVGVDPVGPQAAPIQGSDGAFYGTTTQGGGNNEGAVYRINGDGTGLSVLHSFNALDPTDGAFLTGSNWIAEGVIQASDGFLYGTTNGGGAIGGGSGCGLVYKIGTGGTGFFPLHFFCQVSGGAEGHPLGKLIQGSDGALYGITNNGGINAIGLLYRMETDGLFHTIVDFTMADGGYPTGGVIQAPNGLLYGTTSQGGPQGQGIAYSASPADYTLLDLHDFAGSDGSSPESLIQGADGWLYGITSSGGSGSCGVVFRMQMTGVGFSVLHAFQGPDGCVPRDIVQGADGLLYGTTGYGGTSSLGTVFNMTTDGNSFTVLHSFSGGSDGAYPFSGFTRAKDNTLYGTAEGGGGARSGTIFRLTPATLSISDATVTEGSSGTVPATFSVTLSAASSAVVTVHYATANRTALSSKDYVATTGTLTFGAGTTNQTIAVPVIGSTLFELPKTFVVNLSSPQGAIITKGQGVGTILNNNPPPQVSIGSVALTEGNVGRKAFPFNVTLSSVSEAPTVVSYSTQDGLNATAGHDYVATSGTLTIPAGRTYGTLDVLVISNTLVEPDKTFFVNLTGAVNGTVGSPEQGVGTILNDDLPGAFGFSAAEYAASELLPYATIEVTRSGGLGGGATVDYSTADGTAVSALDQDYTPASGTLTFGAGVVRLPFRVPISKDLAVESNKTVLLRLSNPTPTAEGAALGAQSTSVLTLINTERAGRAQFTESSFVVSASSSATTVKLTVERTLGLASATVQYSTYSTSDDSARSGIDYTGTTGTLTYASSGPGASIQTFTIPVSQNTGAAKTFTVTLGAPGGGLVVGQPNSATVTILGTEPTVGVSTTQSTVTTAQRVATVIVQRTAPLSGTLTVAYTSSDISAAAGSDYRGVNGTLTFPPGSSARSIFVPILGNTLVEAPKTFAVSLTAPTWSLGTAGLDPQRATSTITIDNPNLEPTVAFFQNNLVVSDLTPELLVGVRRTGDMAGSLTVQYTGVDGTATNGVDYQLTPGILTFLPGQTQKTLPVQILNDRTDDGTESFSIQLSGATWSLGGSAQVGTPGATTISVTDSGPRVQFGLPTYSVSENARSLTVSVLRYGSLSAPAAVSYAAAGGTAVPDTGSGGDYSLAGGTLSFGIGEARKTFSIAVEGDRVADGNKTILLALSAPTSVGLGTPSTATVTIENPYAAGKVAFTVTDYSFPETAGAAVVTVTRTLGTSDLATVAYQTLDSDSGTTAVPGTDYTPTSGTITFGFGQKTQTFQVPIANDGIPDNGAVSVALGLSGPGGGLVLGSTTYAKLWIVRE